MLVAASGRNTAMKCIPRAVAIAALTAAALGGSASAASFGLVATIPLPGSKLDNFDIGYVDSNAGRYYLADRSNAAIDIVDTRKNAFVGRVTGFIGVKLDANRRAVNNMSGPNGVAFDPGKKQLWVGDGDSTVKIIDVAVSPAKLIATVSTGGQKRADELTVDTKDGVVLVGNNADRPSFVTLISTNAGHAIIAKIEMTDASEGIDQTTYMPETGLFYASVPVWKEQKNHGGLAVIDPKNAKLLRLIPIDDCMPAGSAHGPGTKLIVGCSAGSKTRTPGMSPATVIVDVAAEKIVKVVHEIGGMDEVWYNPGARQYYTASRDQPGGPVLGIINAETDSWLENVPTGENAHSVAADAKNNAVFVPLTAPNPACADGCIGVYRAK
jgi:DNA-binding beta-propeller fold protein YncE